MGCAVVAVDFSIFSMGVGGDGSNFDADVREGAGEGAMSVVEGAGHLSMVFLHDPHRCAYGAACLRKTYPGMAGTLNRCSRRNAVCICQDLYISLSRYLSLNPLVLDYLLSL